MTREAKKKEIEEIKPSFSWKYILLIIISAIILAFIGGLITYLFKDSPNRELTVYDNEPKSLLNNNALPKEIISNYLLKDKNGKQNKKISSLFLKTIIIRNTGNKDGENIPLSVCLERENIFLIDDPEIKTNPKKIIAALKMEKQTGSTNTKHIWSIPLLQPGEAVIFEYMIYSEKKVKDFKVTPIVRKKDWKVKEGTILEQQKVKLSTLLFPFSISMIIAVFISFVGLYFITKRYAIAVAIDGKTTSISIVPKACTGDKKDKGYNT